jgi:predicted PurR-regulated permease PerM
MQNNNSRRITELTVGEAKKVVVYTVLISVATGLLTVLLGRLLVALLLGVVAATYLLPFQRWFEQRFRVRDGSALVTIALIVLPLVALVGYVVYELSAYTNLLQEHRQGIIQPLSQALAKYLPLAPATARAGLEAGFAAVIASSVEAAQGLRRQTPMLLASLTLFFFTVFYVLTRRERLNAYLKLRIPGVYLPLYERLSANIGSALNGVLKAVFVDQLIKAVVILVLNLVFDVPLAVALAVLTFMIGFFPLLGEWAIYIPVSIYLLVFQNAPLNAALYLGIGICLTICSSLLLRPRLASQGNRQFNFYWMLVALVTGVFSFGIPGIVLGPAILGFVKALLDTLAGQVRPASSLLVQEMRQDLQPESPQTVAAPLPLAEAETQPSGR